MWLKKLIRIANTLNAYCTCHHGLVSSLCIIHPVNECLLMYSVKLQNPVYYRLNLVKATECLLPELLVSYTVACPGHGFYSF
jgi:hypothetical protein